MIVMQLTHTACIHPSILRVGGYPPSYLLNTLFSSALPVNKSTLSNSNAVYFTVNGIYHYMFCPTSSPAHKRKTEVQTERGGSSYPLAHTVSGLSLRNQGRKVMKSWGCGRPPSNGCTSHLTQSVLLAAHNHVLFTIHMACTLDYW